MAQDTNPNTPARPSTLRRLIPYVVFAAVVAGFLWWFFSDTQKITRSIDALHSDSRKTQEEHLGYLRKHPNKKLVNELLAAAVQDEDKAWTVRRMAAAELLRRERLPDLERVLKEGALGARTVVVDVLKDKQFFKETWAKDPVYRVPETLQAWLADRDQPQRARAVQVAKILDWREGLPAIRPLLDRANAGGGKDGRMILEAAASAVQRFRDCESVPALMKLARDDEVGQVRMRAMQEVHRMVFEHDACPGAVSEDDMKALVVTRLDDEERSVRMAAMIIYKLQPAWAKDSVETLRNVLADTGRQAGERRLAVEVLIAAEDPDFLRALPKWFHDDSKEVRSSAAQAVRKFPPKSNAFLGSLIGVIRNETENKLAFDSAAEQLRDAAGRWMGVPKALADKSVGSEGRRAFQSVLNGLFDGGEAQGVTREGFSVGWFRWHAQHLGLEGEDIDAAESVYRQFWDAASKKDIAGAKAALEGDRFNKRGLFADMRGWIEANQ